MTDDSASVFHCSVPSALPSACYKDNTTLVIEVHMHSHVNNEIVFLTCGTPSDGTGEISAHTIKTS